MGGEGASGGLEAARLAEHAGRNVMAEIIELVMDPVLTAALYARSERALINPGGAAGRGNYCDERPVLAAARPKKSYRSRSPYADGSRGEEHEVARTGFEKTGGR
jgi:hypothetical protein